MTTVIDLRIAIRSLGTTPAFSLAAIGTVALVVALASTVLAVVDHVLLRQIGIPHADRVVAICERISGQGPGFCGASPPNVVDVATRIPGVEAAGIARQWAFRVTHRGSPLRAQSGIATAGAFEAAGATTSHGRVFTADEAGPGRDRVALVSHRFWREQLGADPAVVGRELMIDGVPHPIIGVLASRSIIPSLDHVDLWKPVHIVPTDSEHRGWPGFLGIARLSPGARATATSAIATLAAIIKRDHFGDKPEWWLSFLPVRDLVVGDTRQALMLFLTASAFVFLIGYSNVAALFIARAGARTRDVALRRALGATRWRVAQVVLAECIVVAIAGTVLGLVAAAWLTTVVQWIAPSGLPRLEEVRFDARVAVLAALPSLALAIGFGLLPALHNTRGEVRSLLIGGTRTLGGCKHSRSGRVLVMAECALAIALLAAATLLTRSFATQVAWNPGFDPSRVLTTWAFSGNSHGVAVAAQIARVADSLRAMPGVAAVSWGSAGPMFGGLETEDVIDAARPGTPLATARWFDTGPGYFATLGVPVVRGREFTAADDATAPRVAVINERLATILYGNRDPVGQVLTMAEGRRQLTVVGVTRDVPPLNPGDAIRPEVYWPLAQAPRQAAYLVVRTAGPAAPVRRLVERRLPHLDAALETGAVWSLDDALAKRLRAPRFSALLTGAFSALALLLAVAGTFGLQAYTVTQRTREFGVRLALGGTTATIVVEVLRDAAGVALGGLVLGAPLALLVGRILQSQLAGVSPHDPLALVAGFAGLAGLTMLAAWIPARRAVRIQPVEAMRADG